MPNARRTGPAPWKPLTALSGPITLPIEFNTSTKPRYHVGVACSVFNELHPRRKMLQSNGIGDDAVSFGAHLGGLAIWSR